ncbi:MAG: hypothetical protein P4L33_06035 [Capsulimonadaceae bacterium]|nr:hypothetical protein [Capsulimonadaceae bacterium]
MANEKVASSGSSQADGITIEPAGSLRRVEQGSTGEMPVTIRSRGSFSGEVTLTVWAQGGGIAVTVAPAIVTVSPGKPAQAVVRGTFTLSAALGDHAVRVLAQGIAAAREMTQPAVLDEPVQDGGTQLPRLWTIADQGKPAAPARPASDDDDPEHAPISSIARAGGAPKLSTDPLASVKQAAKRIKAFALGTGAQILSNLPIGRGEKAEEEAAKAANGLDAANKLESIAAQTGKAASENLAAVGERLKNVAASVQSAAKTFAVEKHHLVPRHLNGGDEAENIIVMPKTQHRELTSDMNKFMRNVKNDLGDMQARRGNSGEKIQDNFTPEERNNALRRFYAHYKDKYPEAAKQFFAKWGE